MFPCRLRNSRRLFDRLAFRDKRIRIGAMHVLLAVFVGVLIRRPHIHTATGYRHALRKPRGGMGGPRQ
jgi:hypothetical protein